MARWPDSVKESQRKQIVNAKRSLEQGERDESGPGSLIHVKHGKSARSIVLTPAIDAVDWLENVINWRNMP